MPLLSGCVTSTNPERGSAVQRTTLVGARKAIMGTPEGAGSGRAQERGLLEATLSGQAHGQTLSEATRAALALHGGAPMRSQINSLAAAVAEIRSQGLGVLSLPGASFQALCDLNYPALIELSTPLGESRIVALVAAGGLAAAHALLDYPDFYKVGVSSAGVHENRAYINLWGEIFHDKPDQVDEKGNSTYEKVFPGVNAHQLKGKLLIAHGEMDENVHPAMTYRLVDSLTKAGKRFDMLMMDRT